MNRKRKELNDQEKRTIDELVEEYITPDVYHLGAEPRKVTRYDKREMMYGGSGTVFLMQLFQEGELVNNRIGAYMILPTCEDSAGFHTHGTRHEQELYVVMSGAGEYHEKEDAHSETRTYPIRKGSVTTVRGDAHHAVSNTGDKPLIIFVITTNEPG